MNLFASYHPIFVIKKPIYISGVYHSGRFGRWSLLSRRVSSRFTRRHKVLMWSNCRWKFEMSIGYSLLPSTLWYESLIFYIFILSYWSLPDGQFSQSVCCRRPCNAMAPNALYANNQVLDPFIIPSYRSLILQCVPRGQLNSACTTNAQCGGGESMECVKVRLILLAHAMRFNLCLLTCTIAEWISWGVGRRREESSNGWIHFENRG